MNFYVFASIILIIVYLKNFHYQNVTPDTYILEEYFSLKTLSKKVRIMGPGGPYITIRHPRKLKLFKDISSTTIYISGNLKDKSRYELILKYKTMIPKDENKLRKIFEKLDYDCCTSSNDSIIKSNIKNFISKTLWNILEDKIYSDLCTTAQLNDCISELFALVENYDETVFDFQVINASFTVSGASGTVKPLEDFESAELTFAGLQEAGYDEQQINQILKASEKNIYLNNINPLVPEEVFRKIRRIYDENNKVLKNCIYKLTLKNKTPEEIEKICNDILAL